MNELRIYDGKFLGTIAGSLIFLSNGFGFPVKGLNESMIDSVERLYIYEKVSNFNGEVSRYGFVTQEDFELFATLLDNDVKPAASASIVNSVCQEHDIATIVKNRDTVVLQQAPGVGKTTAKKIIDSLTELYGQQEEIFTTDDDTLNELIKLGYFKSDATALIAKNPRKKEETTADYIMRLI